MGNYTIKSTLLILCFAATAVQAELPILLKKREPNWRPSVQKNYPDGTPEVILFFEPEKGGSSEIPVKFITNYPDGKIHVETDIQFHKDRLVADGASATYTTDGTLHIYASYKEGKLDGTIKIFTANGHLKSSYRVHEGILEGTKESYYESGKIEERSHYSSGKLHGKMEKFYENGSMAAVLHFDKGVLDGESVEWNPDGSVKEKLVYISGVQYNSQKLPYYNPNLVPLQPLSEEASNVVPDQNQVEDYTENQIHEGEVINKRKDGTLAKKLNYLHGKSHGEQISYHPNGKQEALLTYSEGVLDGKKILMDETGVLLEEATYKNGDLEGRYFVRRPNGQEVISHYKNNRLYGLYQVFHPLNPIFRKVKAFEANFENGLIEGEACEFNEAGTKITSTFYKHGKKEGLATIYYNDGKVRITAEFENDLQEGMTHEFFPNGTIAKQAMFHEGFREGEEKTFHENGQLKTAYHVKKDVLNGLGREWNRHGVLVFEANYLNGKKEGTLKKYDNKGELISLKTYANDKLIENKP